MWKRLCGFGRTSLGLFKDLVKFKPDVDASVLGGRLVPHAYLEGLKIQFIEQLEHLKNHYEVAIFLRFLHYFNDEVALNYLKKMHQLNIQKLMVFETIINDDTPIGGLLDINMIVETGGKLRTIEQWQQLFKQSDYSLVSIEQINPYLTLLDVKLE